MSRIAGVNIPTEKRVEIALTYIFGIGLTRSRETLAATKIDPNIRVKKLTDEQVEKIRNYIDKNFKVESDLKLSVNQEIKRLKEINSYRGTRHLKNLPVRGQRTKTNARTKRGRKVTIGSGRKPAAQKT
jgi:small subunit ribosomal protein S13